VKKTAQDSSSLFNITRALLLGGAVLCGGCVSVKGRTEMSGEDLHGANGKIFHVDHKKRSFVLLKETVIDPKTNEGRSRHTVYWTDRTRFIKVVRQNSFEGIDKPAVARFRKLDDENAKAAAAGKPFVVMQVMLLAESENASEWAKDDNYLVGLFVADPASHKHRGGTVEINGQKIPVRLRGPRAQVDIRKAAASGDISNGLWKTSLKGTREDGRFVVQKMDIFQLVDPRAVDNPQLPRVLVIGDSISMNYHRTTKAELDGIANYYRIESNSGPSDRGVVCVELWLGDYEQKGLHWDLIQFNHGLHDLKQLYNEESGTYGTYQVAIEDYKKNLEREIAIMKKTGAKLMWCATTPVPNNSSGRWGGVAMGRRKDEDLVFNRAALEVISRHPEIMVNDLNGFIRRSRSLDNWRKGKDVHFWGRAEQEIVGRAVADAIRKALEK